jgi:flagellar protein FlaG
MAIDSINQGNTAARPVSSPAAVGKAAQAAVPARQDLPLPGQTSPPAAPASGSAGDIRRAVQDLNHYVQSLRRDLRFSVDEESGETVVRVTDPENGEVIRQIPSEEVLAIARSLEKAQGLLLSTQA